MSRYIKVEYSLYEPTRVIEIGDDDTVDEILDAIESDIKENVSFAYSEVDEDGCLI